MLEIIIKGFTTEQIEGLATQEGWNKQVMTTTESPNYLIDNPQTALQFLDEKFMSPIRASVKAYRLAEAKALAEQKKDEADAELKAIEEADKPFIDSLIQISVE